MKPETQKKINELLAVLDLTEEEQWKWATARANEFWPDEDIFYGYPEKYLADLAFRLRLKPSRKYHDALVKVYEHLWMHGKVHGDYVNWLEYSITPIDRIIAALIAKELQYD